MLNIRENIAALAIMSVYVLFLGIMPSAFAAITASEANAPVIEAPADPLAKFRNAESLDKTELKELLKTVGFEGPSLKVAWAVAMKESNGRPLAFNGNLSTGDKSYGIFQINMLGDLGEDRRERYELDSNKDLFDPVTNAQIAFEMTRGGEDWSSWKITPGTSNGERYDSLIEQFPRTTK